MKRIVLMIIPALIFGAMLTGCGAEVSSDNADNANLVGSTWGAKTKDALFTLHFVDEADCVLFAGRNDGTLSGNLTAYTWEHNTVSSKLGQFNLYKVHGYPEGGYAGYGYIEGGKLNLVLYYAEDVELLNLWFTRKK